METRLKVVMYHYVRDLPNTRFPEIKGLLTDEFRRQVDYLSAIHEMASLESALEFLAGNYQPKRDLCLLTFDDGLKEHFTDVFPLLEQMGIQGLFFLITCCIHEHRVVSVHKNHFLTAELGFEDYQRVFLGRLSKLCPDLDTSVDPSVVERTYRWDTPQVAAFKYLFNFQLEDSVRTQVLEELFKEYLGSETEFSKQLYLSWEETKQMQEGGMLMGGHSHRHLPLGRLDPDTLESEIRLCSSLLNAHLHSQAVWPFSYPYGKRGDAFDSATIECLRNVGFDCGFTTEIGDNEADVNCYEILRIDTKDVSLPMSQQPAPAGR